MNAIIQILKYIINYNPWYLIPIRVAQAIFYQCYKRLTGNIISKSLFNGKKILLFPNNPISTAFVYTAIPDKTEILTLRKMADKHTIFLDVGANVGAYSLLLLDKVVTVYAFEAHPVSANFCKMNFLLNGVNGDHVLPMAVSDTPEPKFFSNLNDGSPINKVVGSAQGALSVPAITLDEFVQQQKFAFATNFILKVDVEGFEHEVFLGAKNFLQSGAVKAIIFEMLSSEDRKAMNLLESLGYQVKTLAGNNMLAVPLNSK